MNAPDPRYTMLRRLAGVSNSEQRRELLRKVTEALGRGKHSDAEFAELDDILSAVAAEYSTEVRMELARLLATSANRFSRTAESFAMDTIEVAAPVLRHSMALTDETLLRVVAQKSQEHMLAVTQRASVSRNVSHALALRGDDTVVSSLLANQKAEIGEETFDVVARRAEASPALQVPLVRRPDVPVDLLHDLYAHVEASLKREIIQKFDKVPTAEIEKAFKRSRSRITQAYRRLPKDFVAAQSRVEQLAARGQLQPSALATLMREGPAARTAFKFAFAASPTLSMVWSSQPWMGRSGHTGVALPRSAFERGLFVTLAIVWTNQTAAPPMPKPFAQLYPSVPVQAAQRALRFWKARTTHNRL